MTRLATWVLLAALATGAARADVVVVRDPDGALGRVCCPVACALTAGAVLRSAPASAIPAVREIRAGRPFGPWVPAQWTSRTRDGLVWILTPGPRGDRVFEVGVGSRPASREVTAELRSDSRQVELHEAGHPILRYNHARIEPGALLDRVAPGNRMYAVARSDYIHPLYGLHGEELTKDWPIDHPHHRGIYWAWPEVDWRGRRGDLHALQEVFAYPLGKPLLVSGPVFGQIEAQNVWRWKDGGELVRERVTIRAYRETSCGRCIDLDLEFRAIADDVLLARRGTSHYGGLNVRFSEVAGQRVICRQDMIGEAPRMAFAETAGRFGGAELSSSVSVHQHAKNPAYPGEWVLYGNLNWMQPTFPQSGARYRLRKGELLRLRFRLWVRDGGPVPEELLASEWVAYNTPAASVQGVASGQTMDRAPPPRPLR